MVYREDNRDYELIQKKVNGKWTVLIVFNGSEFTVKEISKASGVSMPTLRKRLRRMMPMDKVVFVGRLPDMLEYYEESQLSDVLTESIERRNADAGNQPDYTIATEVTGNGKQAQTMTYKGETFRVMDRAADHGLRVDTVRYRISKGKSYDEVFSTKPLPTTASKPKINYRKAPSLAALKTVLSGQSVHEFVSKLLTTKNNVFSAHDTSPVYNADHLYAANSEQGVAA